MEAAAPPPDTACQLLQLPDGCLLRVLQRLANDDNHNHHSLFSAARAHSRLHAAAAEALSALQVAAQSQEQVDGALLYLSRHGQRVSSVCFSGRRPERGVIISPGASESRIRHLPSQCSQLCSLSFTGIDLQLGASSDHQGVLQVCGAQLTRLEVDGSFLLDRTAADTAAALAALTGLAHLELNAPNTTFVRDRLPGQVVSALSRLTHLTFDLWIVEDAAATLDGHRPPGAAAGAQALVRVGGRHHTRSAVRAAAADTAGAEQRVPGASSAREHQPAAAPGAGLQRRHWRRHRH
jgi:hypothetical protein